MKSIFQLITLLCLSVMASMMESCSTKNEKIVLAYVTSHGATLPDPDLVTHINYAFAHVAYIIHSGFISGYQNRYGDNLKPPTNVYHRMTA